jgi:hypothetical protein
MKIRLTIALTAVLALLIAAPAAAEPQWAPAEQATVTPGVQMVTQGGQCTANFAFFDEHDDVYLGYSAHCAGLGAATDTNGCDAGSRPLGTDVQIEGADNAGTLAYSSWLAMQAANEQDSNTCAFNDFALVRLDDADHVKVNPTIPFWGGPTGIVSETGFGDKALTYGNSSLRLGIELLKPKEGYSLGSSAGGWNHTVYTATPGVPGDSGSAFIDGAGRAFGSLSTLQILPLAGSNGVTDLSRALDYASASGGPDVTLANGTTAFRGPLLP